MSPNQTPTLEEAYEQVLDAVVGRLEAALAGQLDGVTAVVRGDRARPRPDTPYLWVACELLTNTHAPAAIRESWTARIVIGCITTSDDPDAGFREAARYATRARSVVMKPDRHLGLGFVRDVVSVELRPHDPRLREGSRYGAPYRCDVTFVVRED